MSNEIINPLGFFQAYGQTSPANVSWVLTDTFAYAGGLMSPTLSKKYPLLHPSGHYQDSTFSRKSQTKSGRITA